MIVVADTSPLLYLVQIDAVHVLPVLYDRILIPNQVYSELLHPSSPVREFFLSLPDWLNIRKPNAVPQLLGIDLGESEAIALAIEERVDQILIDDRAARRVANNHGLKSAGTLTVILDGSLAELIDLDESLEQLLGTNFFVSDALVESIRAEFNRRRSSP